MHCNTEALFLDVVLWQYQLEAFLFVISHSFFPHYSMSNVRIAVSGLYNEIDLGISPD